jgi:hypothetical protein
VTPTAAPAPRFLPLFLVALAVRVGTVALGVWLASLPAEVTPPDTPAAVEMREAVTGGSARVVEPWFRWDAGWMVGVARHGYSGAGSGGAAFLPAIPATLAAGERLGLNPYWFGLIVANLAGAFGAALFAQVAARLLNNRDAGWRALALLLAFPTAFFYSAPYNESFGLLFTAVALAGWLANRPALAGAGAFFGSLARLTGVALGIAAVLDWPLTRDRRELWRAVAVAAGSIAGLALFCGFLWWAVGDPLALMKSHEQWGRPGLSWKNPFRAVESVYDPKLPHWGEAAVVVAFTVLGIRAWRKRGAFWGLVVLVPVAQMLASGTLLSAHRVILAALPAFVELADLLRRRVWLLAAVLGFAFAQLLLLNRYVLWQFAG